MKFYLFTLIAVLELAVQAEPVPLRVRMLWQPQAEFAGVYVAQADGLYADAGLNVTIDHAIPDEDVLAALHIGVADIVVAWPCGAVERAAKGEDIVNIGQIAQQSALMFLSRKSAKIDEPAALRGKRIAFWEPASLRAPFLAYLRKNKIESWQTFIISPSINLFLNGGVDVTPGQFHSEYYRIFGTGTDREDIAVLPLRQTFPHLVDDGLYAKRSRYLAAPEVYRKFHAATIRGWRRAFRDPEKTLQLIRQISLDRQTPVNLAHQRWMLKNMYPLIFPEGAPHRGRLRRESFNTVCDMLELEPGKLDYDTFAPPEKERPTP